MFWKPTLAVQADAGTFITQLSQRIGKLVYDEDWLSNLKQKDNNKEEANRSVV